MSPPVVVEGSEWMRRTRGAVAPLLLGGLPSEAPFGWIGEAAPPSVPVDVHLRAFPIDGPAALRLVHGARAVARAELAHGGADDERAAELARELEGAEALGQRIARQEQSLWRLGVVFVARGGSPERAVRARRGLEDRLSALGFRPRVPRHEVRACLAPPDPFGVEARPPGFYHTVPTDAAAAFYPFGDEAVVEPGGVLFGLRLEDAAPVVLDRWSHASHSWGFFGATGSGKSFATALTLLRSRWMRPDLSVTILDPLGEFSSLARAWGGRTIRLGPGGGDRLNPLDPVTTHGDRAEKAGRVGAVLRALFPSLRDEERAMLDAAVSRLYADGPRVPTLSDLSAAVSALGPGAGRLATLLEVFRSGSLARIDGPTTVAPEADPVVVDFRGVPEEHLPFHLAYVLDWAYGRLREGNRPKLLVIDEAHLLARHPATGEFLDRVVRHVRHYRAGVLVLSQHPDDFLAQPSGRAMLGNLSATVLFRIPRPDADLARFFSLTDAEADWLPRARQPREAGYAEALLRRGEHHLPIAIVASTPEYEYLVRHLGADPEVPVEHQTYTEPSAVGRP
ncbi:MAG: DUF87 domain-containing protein [Thermoplasmata archaeon]